MVRGGSVRRTIWTALIVAAPRAASACPVCFGQSDSPMAYATNMSILVLLGITTVVLGGFGSFIVHLVRKANSAEALPVETGRRVVSEGTAQC
jgi:hypothetical protein